MAKKKVTVIARMKAKKGMEETVKKVLLSLVSPSRADAGCINYDLHQSADDKGSFLFYENWTSKDNLDKHLQTPHLKAFMEKADSILAEPAEVTLWEMISE